MSQDFNMNLKNIEKLLGNIPDNVKEMLQGLTVAKEAEDDSMKEEKESKAALSNKYAMLMQIKNIMDKIETSQDERIDLFRALKPFLRPSRQSKIHTCIRVMQLSRMWKEAMSVGKNNIVKEVQGD